MEQMEYLLTSQGVLYIIEAQYVQNGTVHVIVSYEEV
jgi:hypothetical protein